VLGRIAARTANRYLSEGARGGEHVFAEYSAHHRWSTARQRFENGDKYLEIGRIEAVLPRKEIARAELHPGGPVRTVSGVSRGARDRSSCRAPTRR
jgi:hypothetical protein